MKKILLLLFLILFLSGCGFNTPSIRSIRTHEFSSCERKCRIKQFSIDYACVERCMKLKDEQGLFKLNNL